MAAVIGKGVQLGLQNQFSRLNRRRKELDIKTDEFQKLHTISDIKSLSLFRRFLSAFLKSVGVIFVIAALCFSCIYFKHWPISRSELIDYIDVIVQQDIGNNTCLLPLDFTTSNSIRPPLYCDFCVNVSSFDVVENITKENFLEKYAYTSRPLLIKGYQSVVDKNGDVIDFDFIKNMYAYDSPSLSNIHRVCEYQPKRGLDDYPTLGHMLNMTSEKKHAHHDDELWYVGWINCDRDVTKKFINMFLPDFLPATSEPSRIFWTFMGSPGLGFAMHIDPTFKPQWHTQLHGTKSWTLEPPPECYFQCPDAYFDIVMKPGDTIVFHNGMWVHETKNIGEDISIGVAAEYS